VRSILKINNARDAALAVHRYGVSRAPLEDAVLNSIWRNVRGASWRKGSLRGRERAASGLFRVIRGMQFYDCPQFSMFTDEPSGVVYIRVGGPELWEAPAGNPKIGKDLGKC